MTADHKFASFDEIHIRDLKGQTFISADQSDMPGHDQWVTELCRKHKYKPVFGERPDGLFQALSLLISSESVFIIPEYRVSHNVPGVKFLRLLPDSVRWDFYIAWKNPKLPENSSLF